MLLTRNSLSHYISSSCIWSLSWALGVIYSHLICCRFLQVVRIMINILVFPTPVGGVTIGQVFASIATNHNKEWGEYLPYTYLTAGMSLHTLPMIVPKGWQIALLLNSDLHVLTLPKSISFSWPDSYPSNPKGEESVKLWGEFCDHCMILCSTYIFINWWEGNWLAH